MRPITTLAVAIFAVFLPLSGHAQPPAPARPAAPATALPAAEPALDYSDFARLALAAPVVIDATVRSASVIKGAQAVWLAPGLVRFYVTADVTALIRGPAGLPARLSWLVDMPLDARGKAPKLKKTRVLAFARTLPGRPTELQLIYPDAHRSWSPAADSLTRRILTDSLDPAAPPVVTGIANAFFVPGALPGEGETQVFLRTADGRPISLSVVRDAMGQRRWSVALSEVVDAAAPPPPRDSLLWYRLACALPAALPDGAAVDDDPANAARAREDYAFVIQSMGPCAYPVAR